MTGLVLACVVRSQRIVGPLFATLLITLMLTAQGGQTAEAALSGIALLLIPVHVWIGFTTAGALDVPTTEVAAVMLGRRRVAFGVLAAGATLAAGAVGFTTAATLALRVIRHRPEAAQWVAGGLATCAGVTLGLAAGIGARWAWRERGHQLLGLVAAGLGIALLPSMLITDLLASSQISRTFDDGVTSWAAALRGGAASLACVGIAATALAVAAWRQNTRPE